MNNKTKMDIMRNNSNISNSNYNKCKEWKNIRIRFEYLQIF